MRILLFALTALLSLHCGAFAGDSPSVTAVTQLRIQWLEQRFGVEPAVSGQWKFEGVKERIASALEVQLKGKDSPSAAAVLEWLDAAPLLDRWNVRNGALVRTVAEPPEKSVPYIADKVVATIVSDVTDFLPHKPMNHQPSIEFLGSEKVLEQVQTDIHGLFRWTVEASGKDGARIRSIKTVAGSSPVDCYWDETTLPVRGNTEWLPQKVEVAIPALPGESLTVTVRAADVYGGEVSRQATFKIQAGRTGNVIPVFPGVDISKSEEQDVATKVIGSYKDFTWEGTCVSESVNVSIPGNENTKWKVLYVLPDIKAESAIKLQSRTVTIAPGYDGKAPLAIRPGAVTLAGRLAIEQRLRQRIAQKHPRYSNSMPVAPTDLTAGGQKAVFEKLGIEGADVSGTVARALAGLDEDVELVAPEGFGETLNTLGEKVQNLSLPYISGPLDTWDKLKNLDVTPFKGEKRKLRSLLSSPPVDWIVFDDVDRDEIVLEKLINLTPETENRGWRYDWADEVGQCASFNLKGTCDITWKLAGRLQIVFSPSSGTGKYSIRFLGPKSDGKDGVDRELVLTAKISPTATGVATIGPLGTDDARVSGSYQWKFGIAVAGGGVLPWIDKAPTPELRVTSGVWQS